MWDDDAASHVDHAATIGFACRNLRGALIIGTTGRLLLKLHPLRGTSQDMDHDDWLGELANQLVGRVKNKLHAWGVDINLAMPMTIRGDNLKLRVNDRQVVRVSVSDGHAKSFAWIDALVAPELSLQLRDDEPQAEGELVLF